MKPQSYTMGKDKAIDVIEQFLLHDVPPPQIHGDQVYANRYEEAVRCIRYLVNWIHD